MIHYKVLKEDGSLDYIGTEETLTESHVEITKEEYDELFSEIQKNAVHIMIDEDYYNSVMNDGLPE